MTSTNTKNIEYREVTTIEAKMYRTYDLSTSSFIFALWRFLAMYENATQKASRGIIWCHSLPLPGCQCGEFKSMIQLVKNTMIGLLTIAVE